MTLSVSSCTASEGLQKEDKPGLHLDVAHDASVNFAPLFFVVSTLLASAPTPSARIEQARYRRSPRASSRSIYSHHPVQEHAHFCLQLVRRFSGPVRAGADTRLFGFARFVNNWLAKQG